MIGQKRNMIAAWAAVLCAGWIISWCAGQLAQFSDWPIRLGILAAGMVLTGGCAALLVHYQQQSCLPAQRYLDSLCGQDLGDRSGQENNNVLRPLPPDDPWSAVVGRVREAFEQRERRLQDLEQARAALEIRNRRAVAQAEQIKAILSGLPEPILALDQYDELTLANRSAEELFHFDAAKTENHALAQLVQCQELVDLLAEAGRRRAPSCRTDEIEIADADGKTHWYRATVARTAGAPGQAAAGGSSASSSVVVLRDIADQKALQKRNAEFVSAVSHEMKTPLAGIKAYVELLADGDAEDEQTREEFLGVIDSQADRLQRLVENLLNLARIEAGVVQVHKQARALNEVLEEALHVVQPSAEAKNITLTADLSPLYLGVLADRDMLLQAAINLLSNAIKYTPQGGRVTLRSRSDDGQARFEVEDTGVGLSEEDCQRVFEKFYRVKKHKDMAPGTGLGLPLAKHIVEDVHGGRLGVESTLGQGSTFAVVLPGAGQMVGNL